MFMKQKQHIIFTVCNISPQQKAAHQQEFSYSQDAFWCWLFGKTKQLQPSGSHFVADWLFPSCLWIFITSIASLFSLSYSWGDDRREKSLILAHKAARFQDDFVVGVFKREQRRLHREDEKCVSVYLAYKEGLESWWVFSIPCYSSNMFALYRQYLTFFI